MKSRFSDPRVKPFVPTPERTFLPSHRERGLDSDLSPEYIQAVLGPEVISKASRDGKCDYMWDFLVDGEECAIWDYCGSRWSCWGPWDAFEKIFPGKVGEPRIIDKPRLSSQEAFLLHWLGQEDESTLGECRGPDLDKLIYHSYAEKTSDDPYGKVRLTDRGFKRLQEEL